MRRSIDISGGLVCWSVVSLLVFSGCGEDEGGGPGGGSGGDTARDTSVGPRDATDTEADTDSRRDTDEGEDTEEPVDSGGGGGDADATGDTGAPTDTGAEDTGPEPDTGAEDTGVDDTGVEDTGIVDTGVVDTGVVDTGIADTGTADTGIADSGVQDSGLQDTGGQDTAVRDTGGTDTATVDTSVADTSQDVADGGATRVQVVNCGNVTPAVTIDVGNIYFQPSSPSAISSGDVVEWELIEGAHDVTSGNSSSDPQAGNLFYSGTMMTAGQTFCVRFDVAGSYPYFCSIHGAAAQSGTITVQ